MTTRVGIYARLSLDKTGEGHNVAAQVRRCRERAAQMGWTVAEVYEDNSISASGKKQRPGYERMLADIRAGKLDVVLANKADRLTRDIEEFGVFGNLILDQGVGVELVTGTFDLSNALAEFGTGISMLLARLERRTVGDRLKEKHEERRSRGVPPSGRYRTFGYERTWAQKPEEAVIVREAFERVAAGESVRSVSLSIEARGDVRLVSGGPWTYAATLRMLTSPIYAGVLSYKGEPAGEVKVEGFAPIVTRALYDASNARRIKKPGRVNTRRALLSGIAVCGKPIDPNDPEVLCGTPMIGSVMDGRPIYICNRLAGGCGNCNVKRDWIDAEIETFMRMMKWVEDVWRLAPTEAEADAPNRAEAGRKAERDRIENEITEARELRKAGRLSMGDLADVLTDCRKQLAVLDAAEAAEVVQDVGWLNMTEYREADVTRKAAEVRRYISAVIVKPAVQRGRTSFDPARFDVELVGGDTVPGPEFVRKNAAKEWHLQDGDAWKRAEARVGGWRELHRDPESGLIRH